MVGKLRQSQISFDTNILIKKAHTSVPVKAHVPKFKVFGQFLQNLELLE